MGCRRSGSAVPSKVGCLGDTNGCSRNVWRGFHWTDLIDTSTLLFLCLRIHLVIVYKYYKYGISLPRQTLAVWCKPTRLKPCFREYIRWYIIDSVACTLTLSLDCLSTRVLHINILLQAWHLPLVLLHHMHNFIYVLRKGQFWVSEGVIYNMVNELVTVCHNWS